MREVWYSMTLLLPFDLESLIMSNLKILLERENQVMKCDSELFFFLLISYY